jgi:hypothetical protein
MRFWVDSWDPAYAAENGPVAAEPATVAGTDPEVEVPAAVWTPMPYPADLRPPRTVLLVDGVRRDDARLWTAEPDGSSLPALAASYAAGVVRCDLWEGRAALAGEPVVERGLFTPSRTLTDLECAGLRYRVHRVATEDPAGLPARVQALLTRLEATVAAGARAGAEDPTDLLVLDGPLRGRSLPRTIGYVKTHQTPYLRPEQAAVVARLAPGQRCPVFRLAGSWPCYSWYLRLPGGSGGPWSGLARIECAADLTPAQAVALADLSVVTLPRFAASAYKDRRAPQNLIPIAGLEQRLRARLGDRALVRRAITLAGRPGTAPDHIGAPAHPG